LPVLILLLPVTGAVYRWISFANGEPYIPTGVAAHLPVTDLAVIAVAEVAVPRAFGVLVLLLGIVYFSARPARLHAFVGYAQTRQGISVLVASILITAWVIQDRGSGFDLGQVLYALFLSAVVILVLRRQGRPTMTRVIAIAAVVAISGGVVAGLRPNHAGTVLLDLVMEEDALLPSGQYVLLGEVDGLVWLLPCIDPSVGVETRAELIAVRKALKYPDMARGQFFDVITNPPGFTPDCP